MAVGFACPNPACSYVFPATALVGVETLTCPACGKAFQFRSRPAEPAQRSARADVPVAKPALPASAAPAAPRSQASPAVTKNEPVSVALSGCPQASTQRKRFRRDWGNFVVLFVALVALAVGAVAAWKWLPDLMREDEGPKGVWVELPQFSCRYLKPGVPWDVEDGTVKRSLDAVVVMRRTSPRIWLALLAKDYKDHTPLDSTARDEAIRRLGNYFNKDSLEWEQGEDGELAGQRAQRLRFRGEVNNQAMSGECWILAHQGIAYWLLTWAPANAAETAGRDFEDLRRRFALLNNRPDWIEKRPAVQTVRGHAIGYTLQNTEGIWKEWTPATAYGSDADLALVAKESEMPDSKVVATVVVFLLRQPQKNLDAAVKAARVHLEAEQRAIGAQNKVALVEGQAADDEAGRVGSVPGRVIQLQTTDGDKPLRYFLLGVIRQPEQVLVLQCECAWRRRAVWEAKFARLLGTFRLTKGQESKVKSHGGGAAEP